MEAIEALLSLLTSANGVVALLLVVGYALYKEHLMLGSTHRREVAREQQATREALAREHEWKEIARSGTYVLERTVDATAEIAANANIARRAAS